MRRIVMAGSAIVLGLAGSIGSAQNYPVKPIRLIVPYPPGGPTDLVGRSLGQKLTEAWGQQIVVENRAGAASAIGTEAQVVKILSEPEISQRFASQGAEPSGSTPDQLAQYRRTEFERWRKLIAGMNLRLE